MKNYKILFTQVQCADGHYVARDDIVPESVLGDAANVARLIGIEAIELTGLQVTRPVPRGKESHFPVGGVANEDPAAIAEAPAMPAPTPIALPVPVVPPGPPVTMADFIPPTPPAVPVPPVTLAPPISAPSPALASFLGNNAANLLAPDAKDKVAK